MADTVTPSGGNPYLALLQQEQQPPGWAQILQHIGNLGFGLAGGFGQAASTGQPTMAAIGPGLMLGNQMNAQAAQQAEQERMKRLEWQFKAQEHEDKRAEVARKQKALEAYTNSPGFNVAPPPGPILGPQPTPTTGTPQGSGTSDQNAIGGIESGGRYDAVGPVANKAGNRAYGKYQIMDFNVGPWTQEVFGKPMTPQEFLANPQAQDAVFNTKFGQYSQKYGPVGASRAWFAGEGGMNNPNASDVNGMTVQRYGDQFARSRGVAPAPVGPSGVSLPPVAPGGAGPTFSALPAFEGPGMGTIQPGALPEGVEPKVNLPAPFVPPPPPSAAPPPQIAQGGGGPTTASGAPVDPNAPPPPFMQPGGPGGPNVVQPNYNPPQPGQPTMAPAGAPAGGGPAPAGANQPPVFTPPARVPVPPEVAAHYKRMAGLGLITPAQSEKAIEDYGTELNKQVHESAREQYKAQVEVWKQREQIAVEQRKIQAQIESEQRAIAEAKRKHEQSREEEGDWVRGDDGIERFVPKKDIKPGMTRRDKPAAPPAPGTPAGDDHILSTGDHGSVEYRDAYDRQAREPKVINGQAYVRDMTKVPPPTYGQPAGAPAPSAAPPAAPASKPSDVPGMKPVGTPQLNNEQARDAGFADRMQNSNRLLSTFDTQGASAWQRLSEKVPGGGYAQSPEYQQFKQARDDFINAQLRRESGSAIGVEEYEKADRQYFPQPGDKPEVIKQKALNRQLALEGMTRGAGPSYQPSQSVPAPGDNTAPQAATGGAPAPGFVKNGYRFKGGDPSQRMNWEPVK